MKKDISILAKDTFWYGGSTAICKCISWLLGFFLANVLGVTPNGEITNIYGWSAVLIVVLTYGMETGMFYFFNRKDKSSSEVYSTILTCIGTTSVLFVVLSFMFVKTLSKFFNIEQIEYVKLLVLTLSLDAFSSIPLAYLRYKRRPIRFMTIRILQVVLIVIFNVFFLVVCPKIQDSPLVSTWYNPDFGVGYVLVSNCLGSAIQTLCLFPEIFGEKFSFSWKLLVEIMAYSFPILVLGVAGSMNQQMDKIMFEWLYPAKEMAETKLGVYGVCVKLSVIMTMFTTAFRYAYEPYVFSRQNGKDSAETYADATKYYLIFSFLILLGTVFYLDILKQILRDDYWEGLNVVPIVLWTYIFQGVYLNLSYWYKLTDQTRWGIYFSLIGLVITFILQVLFVPKYSYYASAWSGTISYFILVLLSYFIGQRHLAIPYDLKTMGMYTLLTLVILAIYYIVRKLTPTYTISFGEISIKEINVIAIAVGTLLLAVYVVIFTRKDFPLSALPVVGKYIQKKNVNH